MAFGIFLNFEKVSVEIIEEQIAKMTNNNVIHYGDPTLDELDEENFIKNLKNGSVAIVFIQNLFETSLNTILRRRAEISETDILKSSISVKLQIISLIYGFELSTIKSDHSYEIYREIEKIRNDITHFKSNILCEATLFPADVKIDLGTSKKPLATIFTQDYISEGYKQVKKLIELICSKCGLYINEDAQIIDCDGRDALCEFIVDKYLFDQSILEKSGE